MLPAALTTVTEKHKQYQQVQWHLCLTGRSFQGDSAKVLSWRKAREYLGMGADRFQTQILANPGSTHCWLSEDEKNHWASLCLPIYKSRLITPTSWDSEDKRANGCQVLSTVHTKYSILVIKWLCDSSSTSKKDIRHKGLQSILLCNINK